MRNKRDKREGAIEHRKTQNRNPSEIKKERKTSKRKTKKKKRKQHVTRLDACKRERGEEMKRKTRRDEKKKGKPMDEARLRRFF
jgi:hypothetical protein